MLKKFIINDYYIFLIYFLPLSFIIGQSVVSINFFLITLSVLILFIFDYSNFKKIFDLDSKLLSVFFFFIFIIQVINYGITGFKIFSLVRFLALTFLLKYFFLKKNFDIFFKNYFKILFFVFLFIFLDLIYQKITGVDFFGFKSTDAGNINRLTGPFGNNEYIPGSYIFHVLMPFVIYFICNFSCKKLFLRFLITTLVSNLFLLSIFITGERTSFLLAILSFILLMLIKKNLRLELIFSLFIVFILIFFISKKDSYYKDRYFIFKDTVIGKEINSYEKESFFDSQWGAHYLTSVEIIKRNFLFGSGVRSFRVECGKEIYNHINSKSKDIRCSTHPHNFYLEILSETGIFCFIIFMLYLFNNLINSLKNLFYERELIIFLCFFVLFLSLIWPIRATGSIFSNFGGSMMWLNFAFLSSINFKIIRLNKKIILS
jgi:O-antigen ligase